MGIYYAIVTTHDAFFKFTIASGSCEFVVVILQLSAVEGIAIEEAISTAAAHVIFITANFQIPVVAAEVVVNISAIREDVIILAIASCAIISEAYIVGADTIDDFCTVVDLSISANTNTISPRIIILNFTFALVIAVLMDVRTRASPVSLTLPTRFSRALTRTPRLLSSSAYSQRVC